MANNQTALDLAEPVSQTSEPKTENRLKSTLSDTMDAISISAGAVPAIAKSGATFIRGTAPVIDIGTKLMVAGAAIADVELEESLDDMSPKHKAKYDEYMALITPKD
jgi:hypothetical protein